MQNNLYLALGVRATFFITGFIFFSQVDKYSSTQNRKMFVRSTLNN
jgi:hypothetical protein